MCLVFFMSDFFIAVGVAKSSSGSIWTDYVEGEREIKPRPKANLQFWGQGSFIHVSKQCSNLPEKWTLCLRGSQQSGLTDLSNSNVWSVNRKHTEQAGPIPSLPSPPLHQRSPPLAHRYCFLWLAAKSMTTPARDLLLRLGGEKAARQVKLSGGKKRYTVEMCDRYKESIV